MNITSLEPLGYGNPDAHISITEKLDDPLEKVMIDKTGEFIDSGEFFVPVDKDDDGCIDGRIATIVAFVNAELHELELKPIDGQGYERAKVAGGGYVTALAMYIAAKFETKGSIEEDLKSITDLLTSEGVYCGAHTAGQPHPEGSTTGCGANDLLDDILRMAITEAANIRKDAQALIGVAGLKISGEVIENVENKWRQAAYTDSYFIHSDGKTRFDIIEDGIENAQVLSANETPVAVSKDLAGKHQEAYIVVNYQDGMTLSQRKLQEALAKEYPDVDPLELPQAFVVDVWRIVKLAKTLVEADSTLDFETLLYAGVAYQLATAATLTDGSLKVRLAQ